MTRIPPTVDLLAQIREHALALQQRPIAPGTKPHTPTSAKPMPDRPDQWIAQVAQSIAAIAPDDPQRRRKAFKAFLEAGLAREFGIADRGGAEFQRLVATVHDAMLADAHVSEAIDRAADLLLRPPAPT
jgi:hypothetical protein